MSRRSLHIVRASSRWLHRAVGLLLVACVAGSATAQTPTAPSNVTLRIVRDNAIDVLWQDNSNNEVAFDIFRRSGTQTFSLLGAVDANITSFADRNSGIRPNVEFCYRVDARNASGSASSPETCITVPPRPNPPSGLQTSRAGIDAPIVLNWDDNSGNETNFLVYRDIDGTAYVLYDTVAANTTTFSDFLLRTVGSYCYFVSALNAAGESLGSDPSCINVGADPPIPPTGLNAQSVSDSQIDLDWAFGLINFSSLTLERSGDGQQTWSDVFSSTQIVTDHSDNALAPNSEYCYRVRVDNASNVPSYSSVACAVTSFAKPDTPQGVSATGSGNRSIEVGWSPVMSAQILYRVERQIGDGAFEEVADSLEDPSFVDVSLEPENVYCYRVQAFNPEFSSDLSDVACANIAPDPVASLQAAPNPSDPIRGLVVSWQQGSDVQATSFGVSYRVAGQGSFSEPVFVSITEAVIGGLTDATDYEIAVTARRELGESIAEAPAVQVQAKTFLSFWPGDTNGDGIVNAQDVVTLTSPACFGATTSFSTDGRNVGWAEIGVDVSAQDPSVVRCDTDRNGSVEIFDFLAIAANAGKSTGKRAVVEPAVVVDKSHLERLEAIFASFNPQMGNAAQQALKDDLGDVVRKAGGDLPDELALGDAYPNPTGRRISALIELPASAHVSAVLVNTAGQTVLRVEEATYEAGRQVLSVDGAALAPGLYFLVVRTQGRQFSRPVTVVR